MRRFRDRLTACLTWVVVLLVPGSGLAEVSADPNDNGVRILILGITEGPDPIPQVLWSPVRNVPPAWFLNPDGGPRGDGRPDFAFSPENSWPHVVWAYKSGNDFDVAYSRWTGGEWEETQFLTSTSFNEIDPRIYVDSTSVHVVWWVESAEEVWLVSKPRNGDWSLPELVDTGVQGGKRPTVATWESLVLVAAESDDGQGGKDIVLSTQVGQGFDSELFGFALQDAPLDVILHAEQGKLWMDWKNSPTEFAYSVFDGVSEWSAPVTVPWDNGSWLDEEQVRLTIRSAVLSD